MHEARSVRQQQIGRHIVRHRNNANRLMPILIFQQRRGIEMLVNQMRHRMIGTDENRREHGQQLGLEKTVQLFRLSGIQCFRRNVGNLAALKLFHDSVINICRFMASRPGTA